MLKTAIFDPDGLVVYMVPLHFKAWKKMFAEVVSGVKSHLSTISLIKKLKRNGIKTAVIHSSRNERFILKKIYFERS